VFFSEIPRLFKENILPVDVAREMGADVVIAVNLGTPLMRPDQINSLLGVTGSGKTTTLYSALSKLNEVAWNISTAEDPVEFNFFGINQVQMHEDIGLNFATALRALLRQDPNVHHGAEKTQGCTDQARRDYLTDQRRC
jgi:type IV pilus assembly protein PilB